jgi:NAD(P)-dependent dehydrogenase (short-subunit alcohol dehydrogenase family)
MLPGLRAHENFAGTKAGTDSVPVSGRNRLARRRGAGSSGGGRRDHRPERRARRSRSSATSPASDNPRIEVVPVEHLTVGANEEVAVRLAGSHGRLDVLVSNVGRVFSTREETADGYERTVALCFVGPAALTDALHPRLRGGDRTRIVNVVSNPYKRWKRDPLDDRYRGSEMA